jgi:hypothetical protein
MFSCTLEKGIFGLISEGQIIVTEIKIKNKNYFIIFFGKFWVFKANIPKFRANQGNI